MDKEGSQIGVTKKQVVLGDITNSFAKRGSPLVPGKFLIGNDAIRKRECVEGGVKGPDSRKRALGENDNISEGKGRINWVANVCGTLVGNRKSSSFSKGSDDGCSKHFSSPKASSILETAILDHDAEPAEADIDLDVSHCANGMEKFSVSLEHAHFKMGDSLANGLARAELRDSCTTSISLPPWLERARDSLPAAEKGFQVESQRGSREMNNIMHTNPSASQKDKLGLDKSSNLSNSSIGLVNLTENTLQNSKNLPNETLNGNSDQGNSGSTGLLGSKIVNLEELENVRTNLNHDINVEGDKVSGKACSCTLCLKAAYLWMDLLYEDYKGRVSEINKSRRDSRFIAGRISTHDFIGRSVADHEKFMGLESDLLQRWRTLFLHTENVLTCESTRLQSSLLKLKELRESCKRDAEMISRAPSTKS
uniref:Uncharacterized protein n=1 Tax=Anthurium amnicola TaxID=1678845 RepID=A0A1D1YNH3_9ARAE